MFHPPPRFTHFLSRSVYVLRLHKLVEMPAGSSDGENRNGEEHDAEDADGDAGAAVSEAGDNSSSSESDDDSSGTESESEKGKHNKKRQARQKLKGSSTKRCKTTPTLPETPTTSTPSKPIIRQSHPLPHSCPEVYTTRYTANSAACELQKTIMNEHTLFHENARTTNDANLQRKLMELMEKQDEDEGKFWHESFPFGLGGTKMEIRVEVVTMCGPRNL